MPAKQFFAPRLRVSENLSQLVTVPAHRACNKAYEKDEEYFAWALVPLREFVASGVLEVAMALPIDR